jgi:hypothetical protein
MLKPITVENHEELEFHPLCTIFPEMQNDEYDSLKSSIKSHGYMSSDPVVLIDIATEGAEVDLQILDGRNRYTAAMDAGAEPLFALYEGNDPRAFVLARNLDRRHLTTGQKASIAAELANIPVGGNQFSESGISQKEAAAKLDVSPKSIQRFKRVESTDPALAERVKKGEVTLNEAENEIKEELQESFGSVKPSETKVAEVPPTETVDGGELPDVETPPPSSLSNPEPPVGFSPVVIRLKRAYTDGKLTGNEFEIMVIDALNDAFNAGKSRTS